MGCRCPHGHPVCSPLQCCPSVPLLGVTRLPIPLCSILGGEHSARGHGHGVPRHRAPGRVTSNGDCWASGKMASGHVRGLGVDGRVGQGCPVLSLPVVCCPWAALPHLGRSCEQQCCSPFVPRQQGVWPALDTAGACRCAVQSRPREQCPLPPLPSRGPHGACRCLGHRGSGAQASAAEQPCRCPLQ